MENLIFIIPAGIIVSVVLVRGLMRIVRRSQLKKVTAELGLPFSAKVKGSEFVTVLISNMKRRYRHLIVVNNTPLPFVVVDYTFNGRKNTKVRKTLAIVNFDTLRLPVFRLSPTGWKDKVNSALGIKDINFENDEVFSKNYKLNGDYEDEVRRIFTPELRAFIAQKKEWNIRVGLNRIEFHYGTYFTSPKHLPLFIKEVEQMLDMVKEG